jgi:uncharacterized protein (DUF433 family)
MPKRARPVRHPYVTKVAGVQGGEAVIRGTRFPVRSIVQYVLRMGMTPEEVVRDWDFLTLAQVHDALSYYYDHRSEILRDMRRHAHAFARGRTRARDRARRASA